LAVANYHVLQWQKVTIFYHLLQFIFPPQATHHPFYLHVGREIIRDIEKHSKARLVFKSLGFFGTCKYNGLRSMLNKMMHCCPNLRRKLDLSQVAYFILYVYELLTVKVVCLFVRRCGYATLHDVKDKSQEDRMESFFLSETSKYLYLVSITGTVKFSSNAACQSTVHIPAVSHSVSKSSQSINQSVNQIVSQSVRASDRQTASQNNLA